MVSLPTHKLTPGDMSSAPSAESLKHVRDPIPLLAANHAYLVVCRAHCMLGMGFQLQETTDRLLAPATEKYGPSWTDEALSTGVVDHTGAFASDQKAEAEVEPEEGKAESGARRAERVERRGSELDRG